MQDALGPLIAGIILIVVTLVFIPPMLFPLIYGFFGGWDEYGLNIFEKSSHLAGPSKILFRPAAILTRWASNHSFIMNKFPIPYENAIIEMKELMEMKRLATK